MAGGWVEFWSGGARWPADRLSFVTAGSGGWVEFRDGGLVLGRRLV